MSKKTEKKSEPNPETETPTPASEPKKRKGKPQPDLPAMTGAGVAVPDVPEINAAAEEYLSVRDRRMKLTEQEVITKATLRELMHSHGLQRYPFSDYVVVITPGEEKLKVKVAADENGEPTADEPEEVGV